MIIGRMIFRRMIILVEFGTDFWDRTTPSRTSSI
jgi:hypothetical protein